METPSCFGTLRVTHVIMSNLIERMADSLRKRKISPVAVGIGLTIIVWLTIAAFVFFLVTRSYEGTKPPSVGEAPSEEQSSVLRMPLDGTPIETEEQGKAVVYGVMINNIVEARPAAGLSKARLVFELPVEMGLTRFLALFVDGDEVSKIGSIRSARPYAITLMSEFAGPYVHVGGSPEALDELQGVKGLLNVDEYANAKTIFRVKNRVAPHNAYTSSALMHDLITAKSASYTFGPVAPWLYREETKPEDRSGNAGVLVNFSNYKYEAEWKYDPVTNDYIRYMARVRHKDEEGNEIRAKNVAVMVVPAIVVDTEGRLDMTMIGEGEAMVLREGVVTRGTWKKPSATERLRFYDAEGGEVSFIPGTTWVEVAKTTEMVKLKE